MASLSQHPKPLIHVGYPKALSSWLQRNLFIPEQGYATALNPLHAKLSVISTPAFGYTKENARQAVERHLRKADPSLVPVITSESLIGNPALGGADAELIARRLHELLPEATLLLVVREQRAMIRSIYKTMVGFQGLPHSVHRLLNPRDIYSMPQFSADFLQYDQAVSMYRRLWGTDQVVVLPFELFKVDPEKFLAAITRRTNAVSSEPAPTDQVVNAGSRLIEIQRERIGNLVLEGGPFNYLGLRQPSETRRSARLKRINQTRDDNRLNRTLERRFARQVKALTEGVFAHSNAQLQTQLAETGLPLNLADYGYDLPAEHQIG